VSTILFFAQVKEATGVSKMELHVSTVEQAIAETTDKFGSDFSKVLETSQIWLNGKPCSLQDSVQNADEIAIIPPVSGG